MGLVIAITIALVLDAILAGSTLDRGVVGLPALNRLGVIAFARYSRFADLGNGRWFYPLLAIGGALAELTALVLVWRSGPKHLYVPVGIAFTASVINLLLTLRAAPAMLTIGRTDDNEALLAPLRDRFVRYSYARLFFICARFAAMVWAMVAIVSM